MTIDTTVAAATGQARHQRRVQQVLLTAIVPAAAAMTASFSAAAVLAEDLTGSKKLAGLAAGAFSVGSMIATLPLARYMARRGRRRGLVAGWSIGTAGATLALAAAVVELYPLLLVGIIAVGTGNATNLATRYAAADLALPQRRARAIGMLVWGSTFGAVLGPSIALGPAGTVAESMGLPELAGPYLLGSILFVTGLVITHLWLRPDPLEVLGAIDDTRTARTPILTVLGRVAGRPAPALAALAMLVGHTVMVGIMTMTPLHMKDGNHELQVIGFVISLHLVGMYAFSPVVGGLVDRVGSYPMIAAGGLALFAGAELASRTDAADSLGVFTGLSLIGLGWSFGLIAGSSLLTNSFPAEQRVEVQGTADFLMAAGGAASGLSSGVVFGWTGYHALSHWAGVGSLVLVAAAGAAFVAARPRRSGTVRSA